jgi:hypothetical protein
MRTTLTLDEDVAARLQAEARRTGRPFKTVVNERLRMAFTQTAPVAQLKPFKVESRSMGALLSFDNIGAALEELEGPRHR